MLVAGQAQERGAHQRPAFQVEGGPRLVRRQSSRLELPFLGGQAPEILDGQREVKDRGDDLCRLALGRPEGGAQRLVAPHDLVQAAAQSLRVERAPQAQRGRDVVEGAAGLELVEEPQTLLGEGQRQVPIARRAREGRGRPRRAEGSETVDRPGQARDRRRFEQSAQRQLDPERFAQARDELRRQERVAARLEEVVVKPRALDPQDHAPQTRQLLLVGRARRDERLVGCRPRRRRGRKRLAVQLAVGRPGQPLQEHERRWNHVVGQGGGQETPQVAGRRRGLPRLRHHVRHQTPVAIPLLPHLDGAFGDPRMLLKGGLDLPRLDPESADLDLLVDPAQELDRPVGAKAGEVARPVQPRSWLAAERIRDELLRRQIGPVHVAAARPDPAHADFPRHVDRHRIEILVEDVDARVRDRPPYGRGARRSPLEPRDRRVDRRLRQAVEIEHPVDRPLGVDRLDQHALQRFARQADGPHRGRHAADPQKLGDGRRHRVDQPDRIAPRKRWQVQDVLGQDDRAAPRQRREDLENRRVEADRAAGEDPRQVLVGQCLQIGDPDDGSPAVESLR